MRLFDLFHKVGIDKEMIIKDDCERKLYCGKFSDLSMKFAYYEVCKVIEEDGIIIVYI
jgi:hypothetical protein